MENSVSDLNPTMLAKTAFDKILEEIQSSHLNFQLQMSPFSASIFIKKSFIKDKLGNMLLPNHKVSHTDFSLQHENSELVEKNDRLQFRVLEMEKDKKAKNETIEILQNKLAKAEASALRMFEEKNNEEMTLKKALNSLNKEMNTLKNEIKIKSKLIKQKEKEFYDQDLKCGNLEASVKKFKEEINNLKTENKKNQKKLRQKAGKEVRSSSTPSPSAQSLPRSATPPPSTPTLSTLTSRTPHGTLDMKMDIVHDFNGEENGGESELTTSMVSHWNPTILDCFQCSSSISSMISHSVVKQTLFCKQELARAAALQSVAVRRSTGNDVVATFSAIIFFLFFSPPFHFLRRRDLFS